MMVMDVLAVEVFDYLFPDTAHFPDYAVLAVLIVHFFIGAYRSNRILQILALFAVLTIVNNTAKQDVYRFWRYFQF